MSVRSLHLHTEWGSFNNELRNNVLVGQYFRITIFLITPIWL